MDVLIFDMDGVLVDVSGSYRRTIEKTVALYLEACLGLPEGKETLVSNEEISLLKSAGGFNNDWDLTSGLLLYLLSISSLPKRRTLGRFSSLEETISFLREEARPYGLTRKELLKRKEIPAFVERVRSAGGGLSGIRKALGSSWNGWVHRSGSLLQENLVKRIFQEIYLGRRFQACYGLERRFYRGQGFYLHENLLIPRRTLAALSRRFWLGIASGRPRFEAELALRRFRLTPFFRKVITLDECLEEEDRLFALQGRRPRLTKPHPYALLRVVEGSGLSRPRCAYVGDIVDDMKAARKAKPFLDIIAIGFLKGPQEDPAAKRALFQAGADLVVTGPKELFEALKAFQACRHGVEKDTEANHLNGPMVASRNCKRSGCGRGQRRGPRSP